uniref:Putative secreted peptide n=1 Tax=Anopheles braziliensis TaxID=58242 RepID=A0A2M3ZN89_9DIPT
MRWRWWRISSTIWLLHLRRCYCRRHWWRCRRLFAATALLRLYRIEDVVCLDKVVDKCACFAILKVLVLYAGLLKEWFKRFLLAYQVESILRIPSHMGHVLKVRRSSDVGFL